MLILHLTRRLRWLYLGLLLGTLNGCDRQSALQPVPSPYTPIVTPSPIPTSEAVGNGVPRPSTVVYGVPPARSGHELVYHNRLKMVLLVNGDHAVGADEPGKLWGWDGQCWRVVTEDGPVSRELGGVAYDTRRDVLVLYGGSSKDECYDDTWEWDGEGWDQKQVIGPGVCDHFAMTYDASRGKVVLFGGQ